jgi:hypothetical protein
MKNKQAYNTPLPLHRANKFVIHNIADQRQLNQVKSELPSLHYVASQNTEKNLESLVFLT